MTKTAEAKTQKPKRQPAKKSGTKTSSFGVSKREGHDSSEFYNRRMHQASNGEKSQKEGDFPEENEIPAKVADSFIASSSENMKELPSQSIHLAVTSPPYNVGKEYDQDLTLDEYLGLIRRVSKEVFRVLVPGGRYAINVANLGRKPYIPLNAYISREMLDIGFLMRGEVIWEKGSSAGSSTAWGSWLSPSNPVLRDTHEYILIFCKDSFSRKTDKKLATITKDDFLSFTKSVWSFSAESAKRVGHPAPFPEELPGRLIELYTSKGDVILDPFTGVGTTALAAKSRRRRYVGYDIDKTYIAKAKKRLKELDA